MTGLGVRSTGPGQGQRCRSGRAARPSTTLPSSRASAAPRQKCGPKPKLTWGLGWRSIRSSAGVGPEDLLVPVGRGVDEQHRVARGDRDAPDGGGGGGGAHERDHRASSSAAAPRRRTGSGTGRPAAPPTGLGSRPAPPDRPRSGCGSSRSPPPAAGSGTWPARPRSAPRRHSPDLIRRRPAPTRGRPPAPARRSSATPIRYSHISSW